MTDRHGRRGSLIALEGIDGTGKSTLLRALASALRRRGFSVAVRREPADPYLGHLAQEASVRDPWTGAVYFTVDRHLAQSGVRRDLARREIVLSDRSFYSTLAYQGSALPLRDRRRLERLQRDATVVPDRVLLLDLPLAEALRRLELRAKHRAPLERRRTLERVARAYRQLSRRPGWIVLDARRSSRELVRDALDALDLPERGRGVGTGSRRR
ncbi:MAG: dTMP kinase [Thermoplasmata archaeon]